MNINSRIDWESGMALSAQTFVELDANLARRQQAVNRAVNGNQFGLIPFTEFDCRGGFVRNKLEIERLTCMALLPSGRILHVDEKVVVSVPLVYGDEYYLACGFGDAEVAFDVKTVPFVRPEYTFGIYALDELQGTDLFPVMKFKVNDGVFLIDDSYIPPCLHLSSDDRFRTCLEQLAAKVALLAEHANLESGEGKRAFQRYAYLLKKYDTNHRTSHLLQLTWEIAQAVDYYIVAPNTETPVAIRDYSEYDVAGWLNWLHGTDTDLSEVPDAAIKRDYFDRVLQLRHAAAEVVRDGIPFGDVIFTPAAELITLRYHRNTNYGRVPVTPGDFPSYYGTWWQAEKGDKWVALLAELSGHEQSSAFVALPPGFEKEAEGKAVYRIFEDGRKEQVEVENGVIPVKFVPFDLQCYIIE